MRKAIIIASLLAIIFTATGNAVAESSCWCFGPRYTPGVCGGEGAFSGSFLDTQSYIIDDMIPHYLSSPAAFDRFQTNGTAYDEKSGWVCWQH